MLTTVYRCLSVGGLWIAHYRLIVDCLRLPHCLAEICLTTKDRPTCLQQSQMRCFNEGTLKIVYRCLIVDTLKIVFRCLNEGTLRIVSRCMSEVCLNAELSPGGHQEDP